MAINELRTHQDGELLFSEFIRDTEATLRFDEKVKQYLNSPTSMSGTTIQVIASNGYDIVHELTLD